MGSRMTLSLTRTALHELADGPSARPGVQSRGVRDDGHLVRRAMAQQSGACRGAGPAAVGPCVSLCRPPDRLGAARRVPDLRRRERRDHLRRRRRRDPGRAGHRRAALARALVDSAGVAARRGDGLRYRYQRDGRDSRAAVRGRRRRHLVHPELLRPRDHRDSRPARVAVVHEARGTSFQSMKWHRTAGNVLIFLGGLALIGSASAKFAQVPQVVSELNGFGFQGKLMLIATGEALSALLLLVPPTRSIGVLLVSGLLGAAASFKISLGSAAAITSMRVGFGAFPLGFAIVVASCLMSTSRLLPGLYFVATIIGVATAARVLGIVVDGAAPESVFLLRPEV